VEFKAFEAYRKAVEMDNTQELTEGILEDVLALAEDFAQTGLALFETGYETRDAAKLEKSARYMDCVSESFSMLGPRQTPILQQFQDFGIDKKTFDVCRALAKDGSGQRDEAAMIYEQLVKEKVQDPAVYINLKDYYMLRGKKTKALETLQVGRIMAPKNIEISCDFAELEADTAGKYHEAMVLLKSLMRAYPDESRPFAAAGYIEEKRSNSQQAEAWYHKALDVEPNAFLPNFRMGKLFFKRAEEEKRKKATQAYIKHLQETSLEFAEAAYQQDMHHPGNTRILLQLYNSLGMTAKAAQIKSVAGPGS
jgi:tetratricopeptide (TPR) repeat protein